MTVCPFLHKSWWLVKTAPQRRCYRVSFILAATLIAGYFSSLVKFGSEHDMPPRLAGRIPPPTNIVNDMLGWAHWGSTQDYVYIYGGHSIDIWTTAFHHGFSLFFAFLYIVIAETYPRIRLWHGAFYGIIITVFMHYILIPLWGAGPAMWNLPWTEHLSEWWGHILWGVAIEIGYVFTRYYMVNGEGDNSRPLPQH